MGEHVGNFEVCLGKSKSPVLLVDGRSFGAKAGWRSQGQVGKVWLRERAVATSVALGRGGECTDVRPTTTVTLSIDYTWSHPGSFEAVLGPQDRALVYLAPGSRICEPPPPPQAVIQRCCQGEEPLDCGRL